ncbi:hypothetical protein PG995_011168 [Apiospora arundinis]|uniref:Uncharacterized protein n=1 Tax=Apiospora arundinis TaxID=335852 RepID=A0ABR2IV20_9PEZI
MQSHSMLTMVVMSNKGKHRSQFATSANQLSTSRRDWRNEADNSTNSPYPLYASVVLNSPTLRRKLDELLFSAANSTGCILESSAPAQPTTSSDCGSGDISAKDTRDEGTGPTSAS